MSIFGDNSQRENISEENPLGIERAPEEQVANPGELSNDVMATQPDNTEEKQPVNDGEVQEPRQEMIEKIDIDDPYEKKEAFLRQKFEDANDFEKSINTLQAKLGRDNEKASFNNAEEAINYYIKLESELGHTSDVDDTRLENQRLKEELQGLRNTVQNMMLSSQPYNQPTTPQPTRQRDPQTGQFISQNNQNEEAEPEITFDDIDTDEFLSEFYEKGPKAKSFQKIVTQAAEQIADKKVNKVLEKQQQQQQQKQQQIQLQKHFEQQAEKVKQKYGEQEFSKYKPAMAQVMREYPMYLNPNFFPNGFELLFNEAKQRTGMYEQQQNYQQKNQNIAAQKKAAQIPKSRFSQRFDNKKMTQEEKIKQSIFSENEKTGLFG